MSAILDWRELAPEPETHGCNCDYCDQQGEPEPVAWPTLVPLTVGDVEYVTDRFLMIRADLAPIPEGYDGPILASVNGRIKSGFMDAEVSTEPATGKHFPWHTVKAIEATGWHLRLLVGSDACAVVTTEGDHIGWAMPSKVPNDDAWSKRQTRPYAEEAS